MTLRRARAVVLLVPAALYFLSYFHRVAPAVVAADVMAAFAITASALGNLAAIYPYVFAAMALVAGGLADTWGPRWTMALGGATMGAGTAVFGLAPTFAIAAGGRLLVALGASVLLIAWLSLAAEWFRPEEFGTVSGFTQSVGNAGALVASSPLALVVDALGWRQTFLLIGAFTLALAVLAIALVRDRPQALGLPAVNTAPRAPAPAWTDLVRGAGAVIANPRTWPPVLAAGGVYAGSITFLGLWGVPYLTQVHGLSRVQAATLVALLPVGLGVGAPLVGWLSDRWLRRRQLPMLVFAALYTACWTPLLLPDAMRPSASVLAPFLFLMGLTSAALALVWSCVREVNDPARVGIAVGFCNLPIFLGFALVQWLTGAVLDALWTGLASGGVRLYPPAAYRGVFTLCAALGAAAALAAAFITETRCRNVWTPPTP